MHTAQALIPFSELAQNTALTPNTHLFAANITSYPRGARARTNESQRPSKEPRINPPEATKPCLATSNKNGVSRIKRSGKLFAIRLPAVTGSRSPIRARDRRSKKRCKLEKPIPTNVQQSPRIRRRITITLSTDLRSPRRTGIRAKHLPVPKHRKQHPRLHPRQLERLLTQRSVPCLHAGYPPPPPSLL